jgi:hypothetical protein
MARINIEQCWWTDPRREKLGLLLGSMLLADAVVIRAWKVAQEFWGNERGLIPKHIFATLEANANLIQANLAEEREDGFYIRGSSQYLEWVTERRRAAREGGKKSAENRSKKAKQTPTKSKQTQASGSISGSNSDSISDLDSGGIARTAKAVAPIGQNLIAHYCDEYKKRYGVNPVIRPQDARLLKTAGDSLGSDKVKALLSSYLSMSTSWFLKKSHDVVTFYSNLNQIQKFAQTGEVVTMTDAKNAESVSALQNQLRRLGGGGGDL